MCIHPKQSHHGHTPHAHEMPGSTHNICHIFPVRGKAPAHGQKVTEIVKAVFKGTPGIYRAHGKPAESPVIPGCGKPLWINALRISAVL